MLGKLLTVYEQGSYIDNVIQTHITNTQEYDI